MSDMIHITGHKNPDTDSIVASLAYAELKRELGFNAIACRIGDLNSETEFILKKFGVMEPVYIQNAKVKLYDVVFDEAILVKEDCTMKEAWDNILAIKAASLFVVDEDERLLGVVSMSDVSKFLMGYTQDSNQASLCDVEFSTIAKVLHGMVVVKCTERKNNGEVHLLTSNKKHYEKFELEDSIVIVGDNHLLQHYALDQNISCMILVDHLEIYEDILQKAKEKNICVIRTNDDAVTVARNINSAVSIKDIVHHDLVTFSYNEYIDDVIKRMAKTRFRAYPVVDNDNKVVGSVSRFHLMSHRKKKFILVDHNEMSQTIDDIDEAEILEIVDHHRIGDVETNYPIKFRNEIVGSSNTIIAMIYKENGITPTKEIASLMTCAIISDTMNLKSPTTTQIDCDIVEELAEIAGIDRDKIAEEMFTAVATLKGRSFSEILYNDFKEYSIDGRRIAIGQINITRENELLEIQSEFIEYMEHINSINRFDIMMMCFTRVNGTGSNLVFVGDLSKAVPDAFVDCGKQDDLYYVEGIVSRKKQIIPTLSSYLEKL